jgi:hypothetical protein
MGELITNRVQDVPILPHLVASRNAAGGRHVRVRYRFLNALSFAS